VTELGTADDTKDVETTADSASISMELRIF